MQSDDTDQPYRRIFEAVHDGLILIEIETGLVIEANPAAAAMHGYPREAFLGLPLSSLAESDSYAKYDEWVEMIQAGRAFQATATHLRQDGTPFTVEMTGTGCTYKGRACVLGVVRDAGVRGQTEARFSQQTAAGDAGLATFVKEVQSAAALKERKRLARNLHDAVNQSLFSASLIAEVLPRLWERHPEQILESLEDLRRLTRGALAEMRGLLVELQPLALIDSELEDLVRILGDAFTGRTNIPVIVSVTGPISLPTEVQAAFYKVCKEALNNIDKHARAGRVEIDLHALEGDVELRVRDDGRGFDPEQIPPGHYGLNIMRERAVAAGAELSITSQPGEGTAITIRWRKTLEQTLP